MFLPTRRGHFRGKRERGAGKSGPPPQLQDTLGRGDLRFAGFLFGTSDLGTAANLRANCRNRLNGASALSAPDTP
jgi:hypothetical protein